MSSDLDDILDLVVTGCAGAGVLFMQTGVGTSIDLEMVRSTFKAPVSVLIGFACQFGMMPALAYSACLIAGFEGYRAIGLILICSAPGGTMSNAVVLFAGGDAALSVMMTLCSSMLAFGVWPALTLAYGRSFTLEKEVEIPLEHIVLSVALSCLPVPLGAYIQIKRPKWGAFLRRYMIPSMFVTIIPAVVAQVVKQPTLITDFDFKMLACALLLNHVGFCVSFVIAYAATFLPCGAITPEQARTVPFESAMQNGTLAVAVIVIAFPSGEPQEEAMIGPAYYLACQMTILVYILVFRFHDKRMGKGELLDPILAIDDSNRKRRDSFAGPPQPSLDEDHVSPARRVWSTHNVDRPGGRRDSRGQPTSPSKWSSYAKRVDEFDHV